MPNKVQVKRKTMTKKDRTKSKGTMHRKKVSVTSRGKGNATAAFVGKRKR